MADNPNPATGELQMEPAVLYMSSRQLYVPYPSGSANDGGGGGGGSSCPASVSWSYIGRGSGGQAGCWLDDTRHQNSDATIPGFLIKNNRR